MKTSVGGIAVLSLKPTMWTKWGSTNGVKTVRPVASTHAVKRIKSKELIGLYRSQNPDLIFNQAIFERVES